MRDARSASSPHGSWKARFILVGILSMLTVVGLRTDPPAGVGQDTIGSLAYTFAAVKDWTFLLGPGFVVGIGNGLLFGYLMYTSGLVPPRMALLGLIGGPLLIASGVVVMFVLTSRAGHCMPSAPSPKRCGSCWSASLIHVQGIPAGGAGSFAVSFRRIGYTRGHLPCLPRSRSLLRPAGKGAICRLPGRNPHPKS